jgi:dihydroorotate dehydrogenase (NAD+) catalytic subunit
MNTKAAYTTGTVTSCSEIRPDIYLLKIEIPMVYGKESLPLPGQFYMLRSRPSQTLLARPISVYQVSAEYIREGQKFSSVEFLILQKGQGTQQLCSTKAGDLVDVTGPVGNVFPLPDSSINLSGENPQIAIIGGGIGVAPVAGFATSLVSNSYDFYACFKNTSYGLEHLKARQILITTDDGSVGIKGMLPSIFSEKTITEKGYKVVYACGPEPMLAYVQKVCTNAGITCWLSMESRMACGVGACLGCTIATTEGNKRCCKDGPVFRGDILQFGRR